MSDSVFGAGYAEQYDLLYGDKDYEAECDMLEGVFKQYASAPVHSVLDLGCGTGNHTLPLARRGYQVTGVDLSAEMLAHARLKAQANLPPQTPHMPTFQTGDVRTVELDQQFDAVLMMFAVLGYQATNDDVLAALGTVRRHLRPGGLFVGDVWYGPAVLNVRPSERVKVIPTEDGKVIRVASGVLDSYRHLCEVRYLVWRLAGQQVVNESAEAHWMRYFFPQELALFMSQANLRLLDIRAFGDMTQSPNDTTWNVLFVSNAA
ncbi:MAG: class I SAM-dependent methyltransferase [Thermoflexales bacterium]|nr:class I SAM-dependent methyltransferase [Thermoflexales bacterium]